MIRDQIESVAKQIDASVRNLVHVEYRGEFSFVTMPILYPSGTTVVIRVVRDAVGFTVSDYAFGHDEADMMNASLVYARHARDVAENASVTFDNISRSFQVKGVSEDQLTGAITVIANCSHEAVMITSQRVAERVQVEATEILYRRLISIFSINNVSKDAEIIGASMTPWRVSALVFADHARAVFDTVSRYPVSIFAATAKFHDIAMLEDAPKRIAVVTKKTELKTYLAVLSQAANVIESDAPQHTFVQLARVA